MKILLAEDEKDLSRALVAVLEHSGYKVTPVYDGEAAVEEARSGAFDCMVFDIMMPKMDGITALTILRESGDTTPVLLLTAKSEMNDKVTGLDAGADDYLTKPFVMVELLARIRSLTRRRGEYAPKKLSFGSVTLDVSGQELVSENSVRLAGMEASLMEFLMMNPNKSFTTEEIYSHVWKESGEGLDVVWIYISYLRNKLRSIVADVEITGEKGGSFTLELSN
ncbi:DNA-binding response regulator, OmpR family, contains REC and winged-helix (wHTH) domain [Lachnospiraceae bacterium NE2001]|nr:DNA-binding response regulator, OmpR family, contains REC and winged-helix (wHTH) domain [Lachnospiraceae bacterium NE2001]